MTISPAVFNRRKNGNPRSNNNNRKQQQTHKPEQRRRSPEPAISKRSTSSDDLRQKHQHQSPNGLVSGQVTILRRGESLDSKIKGEPAATKGSGTDLVVCGTGRLGPDPEMVPRQIRLSPAPANCRSDMYAGSAFSLSPSPRAVPLPSFFNKPKGPRIVDDSATRDLRRLLRLD
ncbi:hypothetical protein RJ640_014953 [Escallonia rubra]|uniref:Uncharacterized protein n=1 Tax=Escallonia rubra TaxID=112253 RepID=A0AA88S3W1_9ASTE|nr:hypothetical protein RJ640_014953 [Escallonia rubra]